MSFSRVAFFSAAIVYTRAIGFSYVQIDDYRHLFENPVYQELSFQGLLSFWKEPFFGLYIPLTYTVWFAIALFSKTLFGSLEPGLFHFSNVLLHFGNALLVHRLLAKKYSESLATFVALAFLLHPLQVQAVCWISAFRDVLALHFALWAMKNPKRFYLFLVCACLSKPSYVVLPLLTRIFFPETISWKKMVVAISLISIPITLVTKGAQSGSMWSGLIFLDSLGFYLSKFIWPHPLVFDYGNQTGWGILGALLFGALPWKKYRAPVVFFIVSLLPVLGLVPFEFQKISSVADHYAYFAIIGLILPLAFLLERRKALAVTTLVLMGVLSFVQVGVWKNSTTVLEHNLRFHPRSVLAHTNLGYVFYQQHTFPKAISHFSQAWELGKDPEALFNLGASHFEAGDPTQGLAMMRRAVSIPPYSEYRAQRLQIAERKS